MTETLAEQAAPGATLCPHCKKSFDAQIDLDQPLRLQGVKCPGCRLFVPARHVIASAARNVGEPALS